MPKKVDKNLNQPATKKDLLEFESRTNKRFLSIGNKFTGVDKRFEIVDKRFMGLELRTDKKFLDLEKKFDDYRDENLTRLDEMIVILKRLDQERLFTIERVKRIETKLNLR